MRSLLADLGYFLLAIPALLLIVAFLLYRYAWPPIAHFLLPQPRHSVRGWRTLRQL